MNQNKNKCSGHNIVSIINIKTNKFSSWFVVISVKLSQRYEFTLQFFIAVWPQHKNGVTRWVNGVILNGCALGTVIVANESFFVMRLWWNQLKMSDQPERNGTAIEPTLINGLKCNAFLMLCNFFVDFVYYFSSCVLFLSHGTVSVFGFFPLHWIKKKFFLQVFNQTVSNFLPINFNFVLFQLLWQ